LKGAEEIYSRIIQADADYAPAYTQLGLIYNLTNRQPEALKFFNKPWPSVHIRQRPCL